METIKMSTRERKRMTLMTRVTEGLLKLREAAEMMLVSYRQAKRIRRRYQQKGDVELVHRANRRRPEGMCRQLLKSDSFRVAFSLFFPLILPLI